ncbi:MAG TPA: bifunctional aldolase/short-chain dehydrogenase [Longimicrobiales bacterium]|nr:bifunctional aldolase/short-chain dehydrogenase [Longimicrobiales bacterium]
MRSLWQDQEAKPFLSSPLGLRAYTSRLLGREPSLVLHGGGNTSVKTSAANVFGEEEAVLCVKGSGWDLATIEPAGFAPVRLDILQRMADLPSLTDGEMVRAQRAAMTDPSAPTPSVEAILHAIIPFDYVDHTHADAVVAVTNTSRGEERTREIYGERILVVPYVMPGFVLAKTVREMTRELDWSRIDGMILLNHGVFSFGSDAKSSYERMIDLVSLAEGYLTAHGAMETLEVPEEHRHDQRSLVSLAGLRRSVGLARGRPVIARLDEGPDARHLAARTDVAEVATRGPLTPDHVIRTKPLAMVAESDDAGGWEGAIEAYGRAYRAYFQRHATPDQVMLDTAPRWVVWQGRGSVGFGDSASNASIVEDIARHTARAIRWSERLGGWKALPEDDLFEVEYWELEQAKLRKAGDPPSLAGKVALVTGAASGIGRAAVEALRGAGAAVVATDIDPKVTELFAGPDVLGLVADARDREAVTASLGIGVRRFGGLDILVSNAGVFPPSRLLEEMPDEIWNESIALNLSSHLHLLRAAVPFLRLGFDPSVVIVASKNVPAPGAGAGAYSVAKAGLTQLARVAALELGADGVRVNVLHPHAVFDTGAWSPSVLADRAKHYGITEEDYRTNNLLGVELTSVDVGRAILAFAGTTFSKTTGAQIPLDGGSDRVV